jgi:hypothetical protein
LRRINKITREIMPSKRTVDLYCKTFYEYD